MKKQKLKDMLFYNLKTLVGFEALYKLLSSIIFVPLFLGLFNLILKLTGYNYLTLENISSFLTNPLTIVMIFLLLILITYYTLIDISTIIVIFDYSYQKKKIAIKEAFLLACQKAIKIFNRKNILLTFLVLFLIPFIHIGISSGFISTINIPEFIMEFIKQNNVLFIFYIAIIILLGIILLRWIYSLHYFILEDLEFKEARKKSINLNHKNCLQDLFMLILMQVVIALIYILFLLLGIIMIVVIYKIIGKLLIGTISITIIWLLIAISFIVVTLLSTPISYFCISALYYFHKEKKQEKIKHLPIKPAISSKSNRNFKYFKYILIIIILICGTTLTYKVINKKINLNIEYNRIVEVTAHRGASTVYPENTMSAFVGAYELGADWIELDVQQTKDNKIIVLHDTNLKRTTKVNKNTWDTTYDEIKDLDAGSFFDSKFAGEKIPLLEDVIKFAKKNNMKLNIELKPTGKEQNFEKNVISLIKKYNFEDMCVITSQVYEVLENVKKITNDVSTVYVMSLAYGDIISLKAADNFSIEASSVTKRLVKSIHKANKKIFVWTVNTKSNINNMIDLNVDNIITDDIPLAKNIITSRKTNNLVRNYFEYVNKILK